MTKKLLVGILAICCAGFLMVGCESDDDSVATGTGSIEGVISSISQLVPAAVPGITVELRGPVNRTVVTGADGSFKFENLPEGDYTVVFHVQGQEITEPVTLAAGGSEVLARVDIKASGEVTVSTVVIPAEEEEAEEPVAATKPGPAFDAGFDWTFSWNGNRDALSLTQTDSGKLTGTMRGRAGSYDVTGSLSGNNIVLNFTPTDGEELPLFKSGLPTQIEKAVGTVSDVLDRRVEEDGLPDAWSMSGTWNGAGDSGGVFAGERGGLD